MALSQALFFTFAGAALLILGGEILVRGASKIALLLKITPLVVGLTIVAACTSAPELAVSLSGCLDSDNPAAGADIALGNVVGSNICNILLILGLTALINPIPISVRMIKQQLPFLVFISAIFWGIIRLTGNNGNTLVFPRWGGVLFLALLVIYTAWTIVAAKKDENKIIAEAIKNKKIKQENVNIDSADKAKNNSFGKILAASFLALILIVIGLGMLVYGSSIFIKGAVAIAKVIHVPELVISLTILAVGTSLPELVVSAIAAFQKKTDIAIGNVVGSNIFNLLCILGVCAVLLKDGLTISPSAFKFDIPVMIGVAVLGSFFCFTGRILKRLEGLMLLFFYFVYLFLLFKK